MPIIRSTPTRRYLKLRNDVARDSRLDASSLGVLIYCLSQRDDFQPSAGRLAAETNLGGRHVMLKAIKRLHAAGYMATERARGKDGRFRTVVTVYESPRTPEHSWDSNGATTTGGGKGAATPPQEWTVSPGDTPNRSAKAQVTPEAGLPDPGASDSGPPDSGSPEAGSRHPQVPKTTKQVPTEEEERKKKKITSSSSLVAGATTERDEVKKGEPPRKATAQEIDRRVRMTTIYPALTVEELRAAFALAFEWAGFPKPATSAEHGHWGKAVQDLVQSGHTPRGFYVRAMVAKGTWNTPTPWKPMAIVSSWGLLGEGLADDADCNGRDDHESDWDEARRKSWALWLETVGSYSLHDTVDGDDLARWLNGLDEAALSR